MRRPDVQYGGVTLLASPEGGRYPAGNSLLISGTDRVVLIDPSIEVHRRGGLQAAVDLVAISHAHEDHLAGLPLFPDLPVLAHPAEVGAIRSPEVLLAGFGLGRHETEVLRGQLRDTFHLRGHQDVDTFEDSDVIDLGGRTLTVLHLPGHTAGHCGFLVEPDGFLFLADIDLTSFGPYYGDLSSDLDAFEQSLARLRDVEARWYGTAHQRGVIEGQAEFLERLTGFSAVIRSRDQALLALLTQPLSMAEVAAHRLVYRPDARLPFVEAVELRTAQLHLDRLVRSGSVHHEDGRFQAI